MTISATWEPIKSRVPWKTLCDLVDRLDKESPPPGRNGEHRNGTPASPRPATLPAGPKRKRPPVATLAPRIRKYLAAVPGAVSGRGGHNDTLRVCGHIVHGYDLTPDEAWEFLAEWNAKCEPPWEENDLRRKLDEAKANPGDRESPGYLIRARREPGPGAAASRPCVLVGTDEHRVNDEVVAALAGDPDLYHRAGRLAQVVQEPAREDCKLATYRPAGPRVRDLSLATLRETITRRAVLEKETADDVVPTHPPDWCVRAVADRGRWPGVRPLEGVVSRPVVLADGEVLRTPGYDPGTGLYLVLDGPQPAVPDRPTKADAEAARAALLEVVCDFPFEKPAHKAAWLAGLLTVAARDAFPGPAPLFAVDANTAGAGKGLLTGTVTRITQGETLATAQWTPDQDEMRKRITGVAMAGDRVVVLDNVDRPLGGASIEAAVTTTRWQDRVLGASEIVTIPLYATWFATGNNIALSGDMARRVCWVRLRSNLENPEDRTGFRHDDLDGWVAANRVRLLGAALTLLAAYLRAGRPTPAGGLKPWGSFPGWSAVVRGAVVWVGEPDPIETVIMGRQTTDRVQAAVGVLLAQWEKIDPKAAGLTARQIWDAVNVQRDDLAVLRAAVETLTGAADDKDGPSKLGYKLRKYKGKVIGGRSLDQPGESHTGVSKWNVVSENDSLVGEEGIEW